MRLLMAPADPDCTSWARNTSTFATMSAMVTTAPREPGDTIRRRPPEALPPAHSGHRMPTAAGVMQDVQMYRPQLLQLTSVSRSGCR